MDYHDVWHIQLRVYCYRNDKLNLTGISTTLMTSPRMHVYIYDNALVSVMNGTNTYALFPFCFEFLMTYHYFSGTSVKITQQQFVTCLRRLKVRFYRKKPITESLFWKVWNFCTQKSGLHDRTLFPSNKFLYYRFNYIRTSFTVSSYMLIVFTFEHQT